MLERQNGRMGEPFSTTLLTGDSHSIIIDLKKTFYNSWIYIYRMTPSGHMKQTH